MDLNDAVGKLALKDYCEALSPDGEEAQAARPAELFFLAPAFLAEAADACSLPEEALAAAEVAAEGVAASPELTALVWYFHYCLYRLPGFSRARISTWPPVQSLGPLLEGEAGML